MPIQDTKSGGTFACVVIASRLRVPYVQLTQAQQEGLAAYGPGGVEDRNPNKVILTRDTRYVQTPSKSFVVSSLDADPEQAVRDQRQEGGNGGGGGDGAKAYFLDMLDSRTKSTFWRVEPRLSPEERIERDGGDVWALKAMPVPKITTGTAAGAVLATEDPGFARHFSTGENAQVFLGSREGDKLHDIFTDVRLVAVSVGA